PGKSAQEISGTQHVAMAQQSQAAVPDVVAAAQENDDTPAFPGSRVDPKVVVALHGNEPLCRTHPHVAAAVAVQEKYTDQLMAHPAVVGTSVGLNDDGQVAIIVLTKAEAGDLPRVLENIPVVLWKSGAVYANHRLTQDETADERRA